MKRNLKLITKEQIYKELQQTKEDINIAIKESNEYLQNQFENDISLLIEIFFNAAPYNVEQIEIVSSRIVPFLESFEIESVIKDIITALRLGYLHQIEHISTTEMCSELGISKQAIQKYYFDINEPEQVIKAKKIKHPMNPVQRYVRIVVLAERLDFELFKNWYLNERK